MPSDKEITRQHEDEAEIDELTLDQLELVTGGVLSPVFRSGGMNLEDFNNAVVERTGDNNKN